MRIDANDRALPFANDKDTVRRIDEFGRMHIDEANISKAVVNPYYGREIPDWETLGLSPDRVYYLLRDPVELAKSVDTWNRLPLLIKHIGHSADTPVKEYVVGATGESAVFAPPYLQNSLCIWDGGAIAGVETGKQRELSCSYAYRADMTPGEYEGARYDGIMRDIVGNHVAIVARGRAGSDVLVGDEAMARADDAEWDESKHPRAANGQFGSGGGSSSKKSGSSVKERLRKIDKELDAHRSGAVEYNSERVNQLHAERDRIAAGGSSNKGAQQANKEAAESAAASRKSDIAVGEAQLNHKSAGEELEREENAHKPKRALMAARKHLTKAGEVLEAAKNADGPNAQAFLMSQHSAHMADHHNSFAQHFESIGEQQRAKEQHQKSLGHVSKAAEYNRALLQKYQQRGNDSQTADDGFVQPSGHKPMKNAGVIAVRTALGAYLRPLANDAAPLRDLVQPGMTPDEVAENTKKHFNGKVDINVEELSKHLALARDEAEEMDDEDEAAAEDESEEERKKREEKEKAEEAARDARRTAKDKKAKANDAPPAGPSGPRDRSKGSANDADSLRAELLQQVRAEAKALRQAEDAVRPLVGQLVAMDSADEVYATALKQLGVNIEGVHPSAYPALVEAEKRARSTSRRTPAQLAGDSGTVQTVAELFPGAHKPMRA